MHVELSKKTFIGTVGYHLLGNHSIGPLLLEDLKQLDLPEWITVDELNWGPVAVVQQFQAEEVPYQRVVLLVAIQREGRRIGEITTYRWQGGLPDETQIQACVGDAATGVISVENLLVIGEYFGIWDEEVFLVDVEPGEEVAGLDLTPAVESKIPDILEQVSQLAIHGSSLEAHFEVLKGDTLFDELNVN